MKVIPDIPPVYLRFPDNYVNDVNGWAFDKATIEANKGNLLTIDIDFGSYCSLNCPACFRKKNAVDEVSHELKFDDIVDVILQAKKLGLRSVKFLGAGEPLENPEILEMLRFIKSQDLIPLIFTKGQTIGDDNLVSKYFGDFGITTGKELVKELNRCNASILLSFNSFDDEVQSKLVGGSRSYMNIRNRALKLLTEEGFNNSNPTRLALINSPLTKSTIGEAFEIYKWGRLRNLYTIITPSMVSGRAKGNGWKKITPLENEIIKLYVDIYKFNIETGLQTLEQIQAEGISSYAGCHPCNQVATGMYVTLNGKVLSCPGTEESFEGNYWEKSINDIWENSENHTRAGVFNCGCFAKEGKSISTFFFESVLKQLL